MGDISRRAMLGASGGLIAGGLLKTQADALTVPEATTGTGVLQLVHHASYQLRRVVGGIVQDLDLESVGWVLERGRGANDAFRHIPLIVEW